jgi:site-specific DNA-methyltransferase (adenine-specific)
VASTGSRKDHHHPTQKPVALFEWLVKTYSNEGDTVLDCCMGSGTTGIACTKTGRKFIGIESDPKYFDIAKRRIDDTVRS